MRKGNTNGVGLGSGVFESIACNDAGDDVIDIGVSRSREQGERYEAGE